MRAQIKELDERFLSQPERWPVKLSDGRTAVAVKTWSHVWSGGNIQMFGDVTSDNPLRVLSHDGLVCEYASVGKMCDLWMVD